MVRRARALGLIVAVGCASACNLDTSGQGGGDTAEPAEPSSSGTTMGSTTAVTGVSVDSTGDTTGPDGSTTAVTGDPPATESSGTTSTADTSDTETPPNVAEFCATPNMQIPDQDGFGVTSVIDVPENGTIVELRVVVRTFHTFVGDLSFDLTKGESTVSVIERPGSGSPHCSGNDINVVLRDDAPITIDAACNEDGAGLPPALSGDVQPDNPLSPVFVGQPTAGSWRLRAIDYAAPDIGTFTEWCLQFEYR